MMPVCISAWSNQNFQLGDGGKMIINGPIGVSAASPKLSTFSSGVVLILDHAVLRAEP